MNNIEKKYQIFISSTYKDLKEERAEAIQAIMELDHIPYGMEAFPATHRKQWEYIKKAIQNSDYYIAIIGGKYGSISPDTGLSYTEMEFKYAEQIGIPAIAFFIDESIDLQQSKVDTEKRKKDKLRNFKSYIEGKKMRQTFKNKEDLRAKILSSLIKLFNDSENERRGWVKVNTIKYTLSNEKSVLFAKLVDNEHSDRHKPFENLREDVTEGDTIQVLGTAVSSFLDNKDKIKKYLLDNVNIQILLIDDILLKQKRTCQGEQILNKIIQNPNTIKSEETIKEALCDIQDCRFIIEQEHFSHYFNRRGDVDYHKKLQKSYDTIAKILVDPEKESFKGNIEVKVYKSFYPFSMATVIKKSNQEERRMVVEFVMPFTEHRLLLECSPGEDKNVTSTMYEIFIDFFNDTWNKHSRLVFSNIK